MKKENLFLMMGIVQVCSAKPMPENGCILEVDKKAAEKSFCKWLLAGKPGLSR
jgi:hypothetical protein